MRAFHKQIDRLILFSGYLPFITIIAERHEYLFKRVMLITFVRRIFLVLNVL